MWSIWSSPKVCKGPASMTSHTVGESMNTEQPVTAEPPSILHHAIPAAALPALLPPPGVPCPCATARDRATARGRLRKTFGYLIRSYPSPCDLVKKIKTKKLKSNQRNNKTKVTCADLLSFVCD